MNTLPFRVVVTYQAQCSKCSTIAHCGMWIQMFGEDPVMPSLPRDWHQIDYQTVCPVCWERFTPD